MKERKDFKTFDESRRNQQIIDTAIEMFHRIGFRGTTLDDIASELGITQSALYHYISSKEGLLSAIYLQAFDQFFNRAYEIGEADLSTREKLRAFVQHNLKHITIENLAMFGVFFSEETDLPVEEARRVAMEKRKYTAVMEELLKHGMSEGVFRLADPWLHAAAILGMCNWTSKWYASGRSGQPSEEIAEHFIEFIGRGALPGESGGATPTHHRLKKEVYRITEELKKEGALLESLISEIHKTFDC